MKAVLAALLLLAPSAPTPLFHLTDPRLDEISGIAAGIRSPGVVYVQNDSGDSARFFALDSRSGAVLAEYDVPGASNVDWEDIAVARDAAGTPSVWLADIGDNDATRTQIQLYRVDEPRVDTRQRDLRLTSAPAHVLRLRYPDGPHDAESLAVSPAGVPYVVTKSMLGRSEVFAVPDATSPAGVQTLRRVGTIRFTVTGTRGPFAPIGQLTATAADWQGSTFVVRTYTDAYFWTVDGGDLAAALRRPPIRMPLPEQPQGEGICLDGSRALIDSEGVGSAVYAVRVPPAANSPTTAAPASTAPSAAAPMPAAPVDSGSTAGPWWAVVGSAAVLLLAGLGVGAARRRSRSAARRYR